MKNDVVTPTCDLFECINDGFLTFNDESKIPCAVLKKDDEVIRVISNTGMFKAFKRTPHGLQRVNGLPSVIGAHNIASLITPEDMDKLEIISYKEGNKIKTGYDATAITIICDAYLEAETKGLIGKHQEKALAQAKLILRSLARIGIVALIDEATGYQYEREFDSLQQLLKLYIVDEPLRTLQQKFPRAFYKELYRLYGWDFKPETTKRPKYVGKFTMDYVYNLLPEPVIDKIKEKNPLKESSKNTLYRKNKYYQYLTLDTGIPELDKIIFKMIGIMKISNNIDEFKNFYQRAFEEEIEMKNQRINSTQ